MIILYITIISYSLNKPQSQTFFRWKIADPFRMGQIMSTDTVRMDPQNQKAACLCMFSNVGKTMS